MSTRSGVTLFELLLVAAFLSAGVIAARHLGAQYGAFGYVGGFVAGTVGSGATFFLTGLLAAGVIGWLTGIPEYPRCSRGTCRYRPTVEGDFRLEEQDGDIIARCRCGDGYVKRGRRVFQLQDDGTLKEFGTWSPIRGWLSSADE